MRATFKVHRVDMRGPSEAVITLHPLDPHEKGVNDFVGESHSGDSKLRIKIDNPKLLGSFKVGQLVTLTLV